MHWFLDPITNHYVDFDGRATRQQYWMYILTYIILSIAASIVLGLILGETGLLLVNLIGLALILPSLAIAVRRLHDVDKSGWWLLISFIPLVGQIVLLIFFIQKGTAGPNRFGAPAEMMAESVTAMPETDSAATSFAPEETSQPADMNTHQSMDESNRM